VGCYIGNHCIDGKMMKARMKYPFPSEFFSPSGNITIESVGKMIEEIKTMHINDLIQITTTRFFSKLHELMKKYENDSEMILLLTLLLEEIAYIGFHFALRFTTNHFLTNFCYSGGDKLFESMIEESEKRNADEKVKTLWSSIKGRKVEEGRKLLQVQFLSDQFFFSNFSFPLRNFLNKGMIPCFLS
jgi:hypothetical protein